MDRYNPQKWVNFRSAATHGELAQRQAWWAPAKAARVKRGEAYSLREERLANAWMMRAFRTALPGFQVRGKQAALKKFVGQQSAGYRDALSVKPGAWPRDLRELVRGYAADAGHGDANALLWDQSYDWACQFPIWPRIDWRNCAINLVDDSQRYGIPAGWLTFFARLGAIDEDEKFRKQLAKLSAQARKRWRTTKQRVATALTAGHDFKPWPPGGTDVWSLRVTDDVRAHLRWNRATGTWTALAIGGHTRMGHS